LLLPLIGQPRGDPLLRGGQSLGRLTPLRGLGVESPSQVTRIATSAA
jgi:hypothetical protein